MRPSAYLPPLLRFAPVAVASVGLDGRILDANDALLKASGYARNDLIGQPFWQFMGPAADEAERGHFAALVAGGIDTYRKNAPTPGGRPSGRSRWAGTTVCAASVYRGGSTNQLALPLVLRANEIHEFEVERRPPDGDDLKVNGSGPCR